MMNLYTKTGSRYAVASEQVICDVSREIAAQSLRTNRPELSSPRDALALIDVRVLDHLIVGGTNTTSFAERGLI